MTLASSDSTRTCQLRRVLGQVFIIPLVTGATAFLTGCSSEEEIPRAAVKPVTAYGITLDENATPKQVAFVLLRSIADDLHAAQAHDTKGQKEALRLTYSLAAYSTIARRIGESPEEEADPAQAKIRDKRLYIFVKDWTPIVGYYVPSFDTDFKAAAQRMQIRSQTGSTVHILYEACHNPAETDPAKRQTATIEIELTKEPAGAVSYWRVAKVSFAEPTARTRPATRSAPASMPQG